MLWIREDYFDESKINNRILIHGHTPIPYDTLYKQFNPNKINIDGGCVYNTKPGYGNLIAIELPSMQLIQIQNIDLY